MVNYGELVTTPNTKLLLHLNGNSTDASGNGNNGTDTAITYSIANGYFGQGAGFNGSTSVIQTPFTGMASGTVSLWYYGTITDDAMFVVNKNTINDNNYMFIALSSSGKIQFYSAIPALNYETATGIVSSNTRTNIIVTQTGTLISIYANGKFISSTASTIWFNSIAGANQYCIGALKRGSQIYSQTTGNIDEVIIDNRAWSATEVSNYYNQIKGVYAPKVI